MTSEQPPIGPDEIPVTHSTGIMGAADAEASTAEQPDAAATGGEPNRVAAKTPRTRTSTAFNGFVAGAIVLILLLIFIIENTHSVKVSYFGASDHLALGVLLLLAAVGGALLVGILGAARIIQLKRHASRRTRDR